MRITVELLIRLHACEPQLDVFRAHCPDGAEVSVENLRQALNLGLDLHWLCKRLPLLQQLMFSRLITDRHYQQRTTNPEIIGWVEDLCTVLNQTKEAELVPAPVLPAHSNWQAQFLPARDVC